MKQNVDAMCAELGIDLREIVVSGGGSNSPLFMNIFADVFGVPASRNVGSSGASLGSAIAPPSPPACTPTSRPPRRP